MRSISWTRRAAISSKKGISIAGRKQQACRDSDHAKLSLAKFKGHCVLSRPASFSRYFQPRIWASVGDEPAPEEDSDLGSFFEDDEDASPIENQLKSDKSPEEAESEENASDDTEDNSDEEDDFEDVAERDKLAYERLIIEGADVANAEEQMKDMNETLASLQETYLDGSAYDSAAEPPQVKLKKLKDFQYKSMPEFSMQLATLLEEAGLTTQAERLTEKWGEVEVTGLQSRADRVKPGDLYFAQLTEEYNGVTEIPTAFDNGAVGIVIQFVSTKGMKTLVPQDAQPKQSTAADLASDTEQDTLAEMEDELFNALKEMGLPMDELEELVPIIPVDNLSRWMSFLGHIFYGCPSSRMRVIGIVGSHGKTSTAWILRQIFEAFKLCTGIMCDMEYAILGDQLTEEGDLFIPTEQDPAHSRMASTPYHHTPFKGRYFIDGAIPDPLQVQKVLAGMAHRGAIVCVIECPLYALVHDQLDSVDFDVLVHTNLQSDPQDTAEQFQLLKTISTLPFGRMDTPEGQRAIINIDDPHAQAFIDQSSEVPVVTYAFNRPEADVATESVKFSAWESEIVIRTPIGKMQIITPLIGRHHVYNILAAVATAVSMDIDLATIVEGIESLDYVPGRCEVVDKGQDFSVVVDNASNPSRLTSLIADLRQCGVRRLFLVFGCSAHQSREERAEMGSVAHHHADVVIITSDSPLSEEPHLVIDDIVAGFPEEVLSRSSLWVHSPWQDPGRVPWWFEEWLFRAQKEIKRHIVEDRSLAIRGAIGTAKKGDVVVIAGRGEQDFMWWVDKDDKPIKTWYEDRMEVRDALIKLPHLRKSKVVTDQLPWNEPEDVSESKLKA